MKIEIFHRNECEDYTILLKYIVIEYYKGRDEFYICTDIFYADSCKDNYYYLKCNETRERVAEVMSHNDAKELILWAISIAQYSPDCPAANPRWLKIWKELVDLGVIIMKKKWPELD